MAETRNLAVFVGAVGEHRRCIAVGLEAVVGLRVQWQSTDLLGSRLRHCRRSWGVDLLVSRRQLWRALGGWSKCFGDGGQFVVVALDIVGLVVGNWFEVEGVSNLRGYAESDRVGDIVAHVRVRRVAADQRRKTVLVQ